MRQVDQIHDAKDQRQSRRQQEQQHAKLNAVEKLLEEIEHDLTVAVVPFAYARRACWLGSCNRARCEPRLSQPPRLLHVHFVRRFRFTMARSDPDN